MTYGASRFAKLPPRQSKSSPCLTLCLQASAILTPRPAFLSPKTNSWIIHPAKSLYLLSLNIAAMIMHKKLRNLKKQK